MRAHGDNPTDAEVEEIVRAADLDGSGEIDFSEFVAMWQRRYDDMYSKALESSGVPESVYLTAAFDNWVSFEMERVPLKEFDCNGSHCEINQDSVLFACSRMAPPGEVQYAFVVDEYPVHAIDQGIGQYRTMGKGSAANGKADLPPIVNILTVSPRKDGETITLSPRAEKAVILKKAEQPKIIKRPPWNIQKSIFKNIKIDTEDVLDSAFSQDWQYSKIARMVNLPGKSEDLVKQELDSVKNLIRKWYPKIKAVFKDYCVQSSEVYNMGMNALFDLLDITGGCCCFVDFLQNLQLFETVSNVRRGRYQ
jgi:hypothetical protein